MSIPVEEVPQQIKHVKDSWINPRDGYILVEVDQVDEEKTAGGIIIPMQAAANKKTQTGIVRKCGDGHRPPAAPDVVVPIGVEVDDRIIFANHIGYPVVLNRKEYVIIKWNDVMGEYGEDVEYLDEDELPMGTLTNNDPSNKFQ